MSRLGDLVATLSPDTTPIAGLPAVRVGPTDGLPQAGDAGPSPLVLVPGLNDPLHSVADSRWFPRLVAGYCITFAARRPVYYVSQPRDGDGTTGTTAAGLARAYEPALEEIRDRHGRPPALLGLSMGGFLVTELTADRPDLVERAVLGLAGDRVDRQRGHETLKRWDDHAAAGRWAPVYRDAADLVAAGPERLAMRAGGRLYDLATAPSDPAAFRRAVRACLAYDAGDRLRSVADTDVSLLVVGGDGDPFFTDDAFARAARFADCRRARLTNAAHDAVLSGDAFDRVVAEFLATAGGETP